MLNQILDLNYIQMAEFSHLKEDSKSKFFQKLIKLADYTNSSREFLLNTTGLAKLKTNSEVKDSHSNVSSKVKDLNTFDMNSTWKHTNEIPKYQDSIISDKNSTRKRTRTKAPNSLNGDKGSKKGKHNKIPTGDPQHEKAISLTNFTNDEIRMLHRNFYVTSDTNIPKIINKRDTSSPLNISPKGIKNLAHRWRKFAEDYKKSWKSEKVSFDVEEGGKKEEEKEEEEE